MILRVFISSVDDEIKTTTELLQLSYYAIVSLKMGRLVHKYRRNLICLIFDIEDQMYMHNLIFYPKLQLRPSSFLDIYYPRV